MKMKAIKSFIVILAFVVVVAVGVCATFTGCGSANPTESKVVEEEPSMFVTVESNILWYVVYHRETKVMYTVSRGTYNLGNFTLLVNPDGTPMLYEGE